MTDDAPVFYPGEITLANADKIIAEGCADVIEDGRLIVDMGRLRQCDSAAICLLIEMMRSARRKNCELTTRNIGGRLRKLLQLYRLGELLLPPAEAD